MFTLDRNNLKNLGSGSLEEHLSAKRDNTF